MILNDESINNTPENRFRVWQRMRRINGKQF